MSAVLDNKKAMRQMRAILDAAERTCSGDTREMLGALVGAIGVFCAQRAGGPQLLAISIDTLTRAKVELETGEPMLDVQKGPAS